MKPLWGLIFLVIFAGCKSKTEVIDRYSGGNPKKVIVHIDKTQYYIREFHPNGKLKQEKIFKNGLQDSTQRYYNDKGQKRSEMTFQNGVRNGIVHEFFSNGKIAFEGNCVNGKFEGLSTLYYENGKIRESFYRHLDADTGRYHYYDTTGVEISAEKWKEITYHE